jgi:hypothetical protein
MNAIALDRGNEAVPVNEASIRPPAGSSLPAARSRLDLVVRHRFLDPVASSRRPATAE